jgi:hypothetical protein
MNNPILLDIQYRSSLYYENLTTKLKLIEPYKSLDEYPIRCLVKVFFRSKRTIKITTVRLLIFENAVIN